MVFHNSKLTVQVIEEHDRWLAAAQEEEAETQNGGVTKNCWKRRTSLNDPAVGSQEVVI